MTNYGECAIMCAGLAKGETETMTIKDLRTGDLVEHRNGRISIVMRGLSINSDLLVSTTGGNSSMGSYADDMTFAETRSLDIMRVYRGYVGDMLCYFKNGSLPSGVTVKWERPVEKTVIKIGDVELLVTAEKAAEIRKQLEEK